MAGDVRSAPRTGARWVAGATMPVAVLLGVVVVLAAGVGGTAHFGGPRWVPNLHGALTQARTRTILVPTKGTTGGARPQHIKGAGVPEWLILIAIVVVALAIIALLWRVWQARRLPSAPERTGATVQGTQPTVEVEPEPEPEKLLSGIELALEALDSEREPADAVVRAWLGLQETAEESGIVRLAAETPTEFTARILGGAFTDDRALRTLLRLYLRTRFGDHPVTAEDVAEVRGALQQLVSSWRPAGAALK